MDVTPLVKEGAQVIQGYGNGGFRVSGDFIDGAAVVFPHQSLKWDVGADVKALSEDDFAPIIAAVAEIDVVLLGTGERLVFPDLALKTALKARGLNVEVMDSGAACRTYNVLIADGRRVVAVLLSF